MNSMELCAMALRLSKERTDASQAALYLLVERMRPIMVLLTESLNDTRRDLVEARRERDELEAFKHSEETPLRQENRLLRSDRDILQKRQAELLATIVRLANTTPFPDEFKDWESQRAKLLAEVGTARAERDALQRQVDTLMECLP